MGFISVISFHWWMLMFFSQERVSRSELQSQEGPDSPAIIKGLKKGLPYRVIEGRQGQLTCVIIGGRPLPTLTWTCFNIGTFDNTDDTIVSKTARWTASRGPDMKCTCYYSHPIRSGFISIQVQTLYPPSKPVFHINGIEVSGTVNIIRNNRVSIECSSIGRPKDIEYLWISNFDATISGRKMTITRVENNGRCICNVKNFMDQSDGDVVVGMNSSSLDIKVLYPPEVLSIKNRSIAEGDTFALSCPVRVGNPPNTTFKWIRLNDGKEWTTQTLEIVNVSRYDATFYTCEVDNVMRETGTFLRITRPNSKTFFLNIWYGATISDFYVDGFVDKDSVTVNETENIHLCCKVNSNPGADIYIRNHINSDIKSGSDLSSLNVSLVSVTCLDAGIYTCSGSNGYNSAAAVKQLALIVNCAPKVSPNSEIRTVFKSLESHSVLFTFRTLAYPEPSSDDFIWFRWYNGEWILLKNEEAFHIDTEHLESNLTIRNVNETLYGIYKLIVRNPLGQFEQIFFLQPKENYTQDRCSNSGMTPVYISIVLGFIIVILVTYLTILVRRKNKCQEQAISRNLKGTSTNVTLCTNTTFSEEVAVQQEIPDVTEYTSLDKTIESKNVAYEALDTTH